MTQPLKQLRHTNYGRTRVHYRGEYKTIRMEGIVVDLPWCDMCKNYHKPFRTLLQWERNADAEALIMQQTKVVKSKSSTFLQVEIALDILKRWIPEMQYTVLEIRYRRSGKRWAQDMLRYLENEPAPFYRNMTRASKEVFKRELPAHLLFQGRESMQIFLQSYMA